MTKTREFKIRSGIIDGMIKMNALFLNFLQNCSGHNVIKTDIHTVMILNDKNVCHINT